MSSPIDACVAALAHTGVSGPTLGLMAAGAGLLVAGGTVIYLTHRKRAGSKLARASVGGFALAMALVGMPLAMTATAPSAQAAGAHDSVQCQRPSQTPEPSTPTPSPAPPEQDTGITTPTTEPSDPETTPSSGTPEVTPTPSETPQTPEPSETPESPEPTPTPSDTPEPSDSETTPPSLEPTVVTPLAPKAVHQCFIEPTITLPEVEGVKYELTRDEAAKKATVTAEPASEDYVFAEDVQTSWEYSLDFVKKGWDDARFGSFDVDEKAPVWKTNTWDPATETSAIAGFAPAKDGAELGENWVDRVLADKDVTASVGRASITVEWTTYDENGKETVNRFELAQSAGAPAGKLVEGTDQAPGHIAMGVRAPENVLELVTKADFYAAYPDADPEIYDQMTGNQFIRADVSYPVTLSVMDAGCAQTKTVSLGSHFENVF